MASITTIAAPRSMPIGCPAGAVPKRHSSEVAHRALARRFRGSCSRCDEPADDLGDHRRVRLVGEVGMSLEHADLGIGNCRGREVGGLGHDAHAVGTDEQEGRRRRSRRSGPAGTPSPVRCGTPVGSSARPQVGRATVGWPGSCRSLPRSSPRCRRARRRWPRRGRRRASAASIRSMEPGGYGMPRLGS